MNNKEGIILDEIELNDIKYVLWQDISDLSYINVYRVDACGLSEIDDFDELTQAYAVFLNANSDLDFEEKKNLLWKFGPDED